MNTPDESKSQDRSLTVTSYGVLSILSLREHSTYELIRQMRMSLHYMWPRAESNVYAEPRRLVEAGLATAREEWQGQRRRTMYEITPAGRAALNEWLSQRASPPRYEAEALMKVLFAENGTKEDLLRAVQSIGEDANAVIRHFVAIADNYEQGSGEYPSRFGLSGLAARLLIDQAAATVRWSEWAVRVINDWDQPLAAGTAWGIETIRQGGSAA